MRKTFPLRAEGRHPDRVLEAVKHEIRKYIKRERRRELPEGADFWDFDCRFGADKDSAVVIAPADINAQLDALAKTGAEQCHVELLVKPAVWQRRPAGADTSGDHPAQSSDAPESQASAADDTPA
jgi:hypothetical protein